MQMMADILGMPLRIHQFEHTCALGAAMFAAVVAGIYPKVEDAMKAMGQGFDAEYHPNPAHAEVYKVRYQKYKALGEFIVGETAKQDKLQTI